MEKFVSAYELAVILKSVEGKEGYSKLADIVMDIQQKAGNIQELEGYGWWPLEDIEDTFISNEGFEETETTYAYSSYCELPTRVAVRLIKKWYPNGKFFYVLNEEAIEVLEDLRKRHGKKYRWRNIGKEVAKEKRRLRKIEFEEI